MNDRRDFFKYLAVLALGPGILRAQEQGAEKGGTSEAPAAAGSRVHVICEPCINTKDASCTAACPVDCIYGEGENWPQLYIHPHECIECGACVPVCPAEAIFSMDQVPEKWKQFIQINAAHFNL